MVAYNLPVCTAGRYWLMGRIKTASITKRSPSFGSGFLMFTMVTRTRHCGCCVTCSRWHRAQGPEGGQARPGGGLRLLAQFVRTRLLLLAHHETVEDEDGHIDIGAVCGDCRGPARIASSTVDNCRPHVFVANQETHICRRKKLATNREHTCELQTMLQGMAKEHDNSVQACRRCICPLVTAAHKR